MSSSGSSWRAALTRVETSVVMPSYLVGAPGQMEMSWIAPAAPDARAVRAKRTAKPFRISKRRHLFLLPSN